MSKFELVRADYETFEIIFSAFHFFKYLRYEGFKRTPKSQFHPHE